MISLSVKPCLQQHKWSLYLNAPSFTTTVMLDSVPVEVASEEKVSDIFHKLQHAVGMSSQTNRRVEGFQEDWVKVVHRGQELDPELTWKDVGIESDGAAISVVWKELAAEGALLKIPLLPFFIYFLSCPPSLHDGFLKDGHPTDAPRDPPLSNHKRLQGVGRRHGRRVD